ncbi:probable cation transporter HKT9 [Selaginella moellendorffii]|uniref:probable cation transporter HKT9 n=1 Tax=Selaginella moellendorffii TaxID=88036 RepID=UPI000D1CFBBD|nr:probable cation transporter HKT9 [Selaginella moellendorffii]|eukprot:XP_024537732.1 probable cation transporter HKT9 [Selaginella moellendorffii]
MSQEDEAQCDSLKRSPPRPPPPPLAPLPENSSSATTTTTAHGYPIDQFLQQHEIVRSSATTPLRLLLSRLRWGIIRPPFPASAFSIDGDEEERIKRSSSKERGRSYVLLPRWISSRLTFYRLHLAYFVTIAWVASICLWLFPKSDRAGADKLAFIDCVYNAVSSVCTTGLISVRMTSFSLPDNILIMILFTLGSPIFTSVLPLYIRLFQFRKNIVEIEHHLGQPEVAAAAELESEGEPEAKSEIESVVSEMEAEVVPEVVGHRIITRRRSAKNIHAANAVTKLRDALATMRLEHDALVSLNWVVSIYFVVWTILGFLVLEILLQCSAKDMAVLEQRSVNHLFFSLFASISTFTNSGILPLDDSIAAFRENNGILLWLSILILVGNTLFAPCLRTTIWCLKSLSATPARRAIYDYLLKNPRRCFTHLFPRNQTIWLVVTVMGFNAFESAFFYILSWRSQALDGLTTPQKLVNGIFQSITTRSAGENVVSISALSPSMLVLYIAMMYIAVYPVYLSRQNSQAQDESVEKTSKKIQDHGKKKKKKKKGDFSIASQSKRLIATDTAYLFISIFVLCIIENRKINDDPLNFSIFNIIFEVISAYGNVGLSLGYSCSLLRKLTSFSSDTSCEDVPYSFSGTWSVPGKLLMIVIMFLGRHRGLPDNMDSALQIPKSFFTTTKRDQNYQHHHENGISLDHQPVEIHPEYVVEIPAAVDFSVVEIDGDQARQQCSCGPDHPDRLELQKLDRFPVV